MASTSSVLIPTNLDVRVPRRFPRENSSRLEITYLSPSGDQKSLFLNPGDVYSLRVNSEFRIVWYRTWDAEASRGSKCASQIDGRRVKDTLWLALVKDPSLASKNPVLDLTSSKSFLKANLSWEGSSYPSRLDLEAARDEQKGCCDRLTHLANALFCSLATPFYRN